MKKVVIISPYFAPCNTADMHRIRMNLSYFEEFGWSGSVVTVDPKYADVPKDPLLSQSLPKSATIYRVKAFSKSWTRKVGLGSLALRSMWFYRRFVNDLLRKEKFDLVFFSTTEFPICVLGNYWKKKFGIPYIIDMQDPWYSEHYLQKPKSERPKKYWLSYGLHKYLEPIAMNNVDGLISVSEAYITALKQRYESLSAVPSKIVPFGAFRLDFEVALNNQNALKIAFQKTTDQVHITYIGRGGYDMTDAVQVLFKGFTRGLNEHPDIFKNIRFHFIGTSYAPSNEAVKTFMPIAKEFGIDNYVDELTTRVGFYDTILTLKAADALFVPGSSDPNYTASKIYPYILAEKPLLAIVNSTSEMYRTMLKCNAGTVADIYSESSVDTAFHFLLKLANREVEKVQVNWDNFNEFTAQKMTENQCTLFNEVIN